MYRKLFFGSLFIFSSLITFSQDLKVNGYFLEDSIKIGIGSPYVLTCEYPRTIDIVFPDSLYDYSPYELGEKWFATTRSNETHSFDSAIYYLLSFEIDSIQYFNLPVFQLVGKDSIPIQTNQDSIALKHLVTELPDSVAAEAMPLVENTNYRYVDLALNYPYIAIGILIVIILLIITYLVFGKSIKKWFKLRSLRKKYDEFLEKYAKQKEKVSDTTSVEHLLYIWKHYLEKLEKQPYTKMTTKELIAIEPFDRIETVLKSLDRSIYSKNHTVDELTYNEILKYTEDRFEDKINEVKHG